MIAQGGGDKELVEEAARVESIPGGPELLFTVAAEEMMKAQGVDKKDAKKVRLYCMGGEVRKAKGGDVRAAAEKTRAAGRDEDEILVHMTEDEFDAIKAMWGDPDINPNTGMPEYGFLKKVWKKVKKGVKKIVKSKAFRTVAPIALSVFAPGLGTAVGSALGMSGTAASVAGNAIVRGGLGALSGGKRGALSGAIAGATAGGLGRAVGQQVKGFAPNLSDRTATAIGSALVRGTGSSVMGEGFAPGAVMGGLESYMGLEPEQVGANIRQAYTGLAPGQMGPPLPRGQGIIQAIKAGAVPVGLGLMASGGGEYEQEVPDWAQDGSGGSGFGESLPVLPASQRRFSGPDDPAAYFTYGQPGAPMRGEQLFITPNEPFPGAGAIGSTPQERTRLGGLENVVGARGMVGMQRGGHMDYWAQNADVPRESPGVAAHGRYVRGPGTGRSDEIDAKLSDGEYVIDAETVALLGDGSGAAGAKRLDEMRRNLRKHKATNLKKGEFTHKAKKPEGYLPKMRRLRTATGGTA